MHLIPLLVGVTDLPCQVEGVLCGKGGSTSSGTVHLTAHHLIFHYDDTSKEEMWVSLLYAAL